VNKQEIAERFTAHLNQHLHGSGFDKAWEHDRNRAVGGYHMMNDAGMYDGWVTVTIVFRREDSADAGVDYRVMYSPCDNRYLFYKTRLRDYIDECINYAFSQFERGIIAGQNDFAETEVANG
jgi:hypothetical protein